MTTLEALQSILDGHTKDMEAARRAIRLLGGQVAKSSKARAAAAVEVSIAMVRELLGSEPTPAQIENTARHIYYETPVLIEEVGVNEFLRKCECAITAYVPAGTLLWPLPHRNSGLPL